MTPALSNGPTILRWWRSNPLVGDALQLGSGQIVGQAAIFAIFAILARQLPVVAFGHFVAGYAAVHFMAVLLDCGLSHLQARDIAADGLEAHARVVIRSASLRLLLAIICSGGFLLAVYLGSGFNRNLANSLAIYLPALVVLNAGLSVRRGLRQMASIGASLATERVFGLVGLFIGMTTGSVSFDSWVLVSMSVASFTLGLIAIYPALRAAMRHSPYPRELSSCVRKALVRSFPFAASSVAPQLFRLDVAIVALVSSSTAAAAYGAVTRLGAPFAMIGSVVAYSALSRVATSTYSETLAMEKAIASGLAAVGILLCAVIVTAPHLLSAAFGAEYQSAGGTLRVYAVALLPALANPTLAAAIQARGGETRAGRLIVVGSILGLAGLGGLAALAGSTGAAAAVLVTQFGLFAGLLHSWLRLRGHEKEHSVG